MHTLAAQGRSPMERVLWMAMFAPSPSGRRGLPMLLVGEPGTAKTATCRQLARMGNLHFEAVVSSLREPSDFLGLPFIKRVPVDPSNAFLSPDMDTEICATGYSPSEFVLRCAQAERAVLMLDEVNTCPPAVQAALLRLLFEGVCGDVTLPWGVRMLLAMNATEDAAGGWELAAPLANRIGHLRWDGVSVPQFGEYLIGGGGCRVGGKLRREESPLVDPAQEEQAVDALWPEAWAHAVGHTLGFLQAKPSAAHQKPKAGTPEASSAWPSLRTWDLATAALAVAHVYGASPLEEQAIASAFVGASAYAELHAWRKNSDLPSAADLLDGKVAFAHSAARLDRTVAVLSAATALLTDPGVAERDARARWFWDFLGALPEDAADIAASAIIKLVDAKLVHGNNKAYRVIGRLTPFLVGANIIAEDAQP